jgi:hypothetical protein
VRTHLLMTVGHTRLAYFTKNNKHVTADRSTLYRYVRTQLDDSLIDQSDLSSTQSEVQ